MIGSGPFGKEGEKKKKEKNYCLVCDDETSSHTHKGDLCRSLLNINRTTTVSDLSEHRSGNFDIRFCPIEETDPSPIKQRGDYVTA